MPSPSPKIDPFRFFTVASRKAFLKPDPTGLPLTQPAEMCRAVIMITTDNNGVAFLTPEDVGAVCEELVNQGFIPPPRAQTVGSYVDRLLRAIAQEKPVPGWVEVQSAAVATLAFQRVRKAERQVLVTTPTFLQYRWSGDEPTRPE